jgi:hypothetical protein
VHARSVHVTQRYVSIGRQCAVLAHVHKFVLSGTHVTRVLTDISWVLANVTGLLPNFTGLLADFAGLQSY